MPGGAGSGTLAWAAEQSYLGGTGTDPTYYLPGTNPTVQTAELTRNLLEILAPGDVEAQDYLATQLEGQFGVQFTLKNDEFHRLVFNDTFTGFTSGLVNSAEWYLGADMVSGVTERQIKGWAPATCQVEYNGTTETVTVTLTGAYGDEDTNTSITPGTITNSGSEVPGHGANLTIAGTSIGEYLQSATMSFEQISRLIRGATQKPVEAVAGNVQESVDLSVIYDGPDLYERALGATGATSVQETVDSFTAGLTFSAAGTERASYDFATVKPETYDWQDLINNEAELTEQVTLNATGVTASDPTV